MTIAFMLPIDPLAPFASMTIRSTCGPAARLTPAFDSVAQVCHPPVSGDHERTRLIAV